MSETWRTPTADDYRHNDEPKGFQLHLSEQVLGYDVPRGGANIE